MRNTKFSHKIILTFSVLLGFISLYAQGPSTPEAASFEPVDATDMVNLVTGDMSYVLPLLNVPSPEGGYPLALSYHAGIGLDQEASWVGLGWNLNPGAINRSVSGVPDDWLETKKYSMLYNHIGVAKSISVGAAYNLGILSFASSLNYSSFKATGGEFTQDFNYSHSHSILGLSRSYDVGTSGVGISEGLTYKFGDLSVGATTGVFQSFKGEGLSVNTGLKASYSGVSIGINLSSKNGFSASISVPGANIPLTGGNNTSGLIHSETSSSRFYMSFLGYEFSQFSKKTTYWAFDANYSLYNGSLYAGNLVETIQDSFFDTFNLGMDAYEATYGSDKSEQLKNTNFSSISYDKYNINAQGIGGSISPRLLESGSLIMPFSTLRTEISSSGQFQLAKANVSYITPQNNTKNFSKSMDQKNAHFYFDNEYSSYLNIDSGNWSNPISGTHEDLSNISQVNRTFTDTKEIDGELFDSYNSTNERLKKGSYIETFTNEEIIESASKIIHPEASGFSRTASSIPGKGIGAFRVTALDGKTYHYSLPVYHKEEFTRVSNVEDNSEDKFFEEQQFEPYATHWLLTAVTGADYFDVNQNNRVDKDDYGYWVSFEYGKWSDGFAWRSPDNGFRSNGVTNSYSWGIKEVYYLDKIKTRTHTALFIKEIREDNKSYAGRISDANNNARYYNLPYRRSFLQAPDDTYYSLGTHLEIPIYFGNYQDFHSESEFWMYADFAEQRSLRLDKIMLLKNENAENVLKHNSVDANSIYGGRTFATAKITLYTSATGARGNSEERDVNEDRTWYGEYYNNVLNSEDIDFTTLTDKSVKTIKFNYNGTYPLGRETSEPKGKLTLNSVNFIGKRGIQLMPPYKFEYYSPGTTYTEDLMDDWGYYKYGAMVWSLNKITNPLGSTLEIVYENDKYVSEYSSPTTFFDAGLEFKYDRTASGLKRVSFRNDPDVDTKYHVDFSEYFTAGQSTEIDIQYWHFTRTESNWIVDVATNCTVQEASNNLLVFTLPENTNQTWGRENENCKKQDWIYYHDDYGHLINETKDWVKRSDHNSCQRPEEGHKRSNYKLFAQKEPLNNSIGGGIRVKELKVTSDNHTTKTLYKYTNFEGEETGVTSFALSKRARVIPYRTEMPNPMVLYENVTTEVRDVNAKLLLKKIYHFEVPKPIQYLENGMLIENALELQVNQDEYYSDVSINGEDVDVALSKFKLLDHTANIGRLKSVTELNSENQIIRKTENTYLSKDYDHDQGILQETFISYKQLREQFLKDKFLMTSSSKIKVPNVFSKSTITTNDISQEQETIAYDFFTGQLKESLTLLSDGRQFKTKFLPAYHKYAEMGNKADDTSYKHMLTQNAINITEVQNDGVWYKTSSNITTWSPKQYQTTTYVGDPTNPTPLTIYESVWHKYKDYIWNGDTDENGFFVSYVDEDDGFDWVTDSNANSSWKQVSEITRFNKFSVPLETMDVNGNKLSTKMDYKNEKIIVNANAGFEEMFYSGAEDFNGQNSFGGNVNKGTATLSSDAHTGTNALQIGSDNTAYLVNVNHDDPNTKKFRISLWAKKGTHQNTRINVGGNLITHNTAEEVYADNWVQLNFYADIVNGTQVYVTSGGSTVIVDDFRLHPVSSSMISYVYNEWDELSHILRANNLATFYEYDEVGRLRKVWKEVADQPGLTGGYKHTSEYDYNYKLLAQYDQDGDGTIDDSETYDPLYMNLGIGSPTGASTYVRAYVTGGSGDYEYRWATSTTGYSYDYGSWTSQNQINITTYCQPNGRIYYTCQVRDKQVSSLAVASSLGNHKRTDCDGGGGDPGEPQQ